MPVPMLDLKAQYSRIKDEINEAVMAVLERQQFRGGAVVERVARIVGPARAGADHARAGGWGRQPVRPPPDPEQAEPPRRRRPVAFALGRGDAAAPDGAEHLAAEKPRSPACDHKIAAPHSRWPLFAALVLR